MATGNTLLPDPKLLSHAYGFTGRATAGAITFAEAVVGQKVKLIWEATGTTHDAGALFESVISVAGQLQQLSSTDLHTTKFVVVLE